MPTRFNLKGKWRLISVYECEKALSVWNVRRPLINGIRRFSSPFKPHADITNK